jgi:ribosomal protein L24
MVMVYERSNKPIHWIMPFQAGDRVQVMEGDDMGKVTNVVVRYPKWNQLVCQGVNVKKLGIPPYNAGMCFSVALSIL